MQKVFGNPLSASCVQNHVFGLIFKLSPLKVAMMEAACELSVEAFLSFLLSCNNLM